MKAFRRSTSLKPFLLASLLLCATYRIRVAHWLLTSDPSTHRPGDVDTPFKPPTILPPTPLGPRNISKIYFVHPHASRKEYKEEWLTRLKIPFEVVYPSNELVDATTTTTTTTQQQQLDWPALFLQIIVTHKNKANLKNNKKGEVILVVQDEYQLASKQPIRRIEDALNMQPSVDFDLARLNCWQQGRRVISGNDTDPKAIRYTFTTDTQRQEATENANGVSCAYIGGLHATLLNTAQMPRLENFFQQHTTPAYSNVLSDESLDCVLSTTTELKVACLQLDNDLGCFQHRKHKPYPPLDDKRPPRPDPIMLENFKEHSFGFAGNTYRYRSIVARYAKQPLTNQPLSILIGVNSAYKSFEQRQAIRQTWATDQTIFIVAGNWSEVEDEFHQYRDMIWLDNVEHYRRGLTPKTRAFTHFASLDSTIDYAFKTDDDMFINTTKLEHELRMPTKSYKCGNDAVPCPENASIDYYGFAMTNMETIRKNKDTHKDDLIFALTKKYYPYKYYPPYATGAGYAMSKRFLQCAVASMPKARPMFWEDVSTGMLAEGCKMPLVHAKWGSDPTKWLRAYMDDDRHRKEGSVAKQPPIFTALHRVSPENQFRFHRGLLPAFDENLFLEICSN